MSNLKEIHGHILDYIVSTEVPNGKTSPHSNYDFVFSKDRMYLIDVWYWTATYGGINV